MTQENLALVIVLIILCAWLIFILWQSYYMAEFKKKRMQEGEGNWGEVWKRFLLMSGLSIVLSAISVGLTRLILFVQQAPPATTPLSFEFFICSAAAWLLSMMIFAYYLMPDRERSKKE